MTRLSNTKWASRASHTRSSLERGYFPKASRRKLSLVKRSACDLTHSFDFSIAHDILPTSCDTSALRTPSIDVGKGPASALKLTSRTWPEVPFEPARYSRVAVSTSLDVLKQQASPKSRGNILLHLHFDQRSRFGLRLQY